MTPTGSEQGSKSPEETGICQSGDAQSGAVSAHPAAVTPADADLARLIDAWQSLPKPTKTEIVAMLDLAQEKARK